jgi:PPK2 family polyphosphate:nucleotide phosphotransferase
VAYDIERYIKDYRVTDGKKFHLADIDPGSTGSAKSEKGAKDVLKDGVKMLAKLQNKLYAQDTWAVLLIFQAMDAAGKDGAIKHVMSGVNPQGCQVYSFKSPSAEELDHDFLWRTSKNLPERGRIGIFNRSYYEEVLAVRVHEAFLAKQKIPARLVTPKIWEQRFEDINAFERYLHRNGILVRKFFLHVSKAEQKRRFMSRLDDPDRNWKFSSADARERGFWDQYMKAYEDMIRHTASAHSPWYVVPADNKWFTRLVVAGAVVHALDSLDLRYPVVSAAQKRDLAEARKMIERQR